MSVAQASVPYFDMGRVVTRTFRVIGHNVSSFALLSLIVAIPLVLINWRLASMPASAFSGPFAMYTDRYFVPLQLLYFFSLFLLQASAIHATVIYLNGRGINLSESLRVAAAVFLQLLVITVLVLLGVMVGFALLFVPGMMLLIMWSVVVPACVVDRTGIIGSFGRSRQLTKGHRWAIFGLVIAFYLIFIVVGLVFAALAGIPLFSRKPEDLQIVLQPSFTRAVSSILVSMATSTLGSTLVASIYYELRVLKDGIGPQALASVFD